MNNMNEETAIARIPNKCDIELVNPLSHISQITVASMQSMHSRRVYAQHIAHFIGSQQPLNREGVATWMQDNKSRGLSAVNQGLAAIKKLAKEAWLRKMISNDDYFALKDLSIYKVSGIKIGNWLPIEGAKKLVELPKRNTVSGTRDAAMFALLLGCGLRREEASLIQWRVYCERDNRMLLSSFEGKGGKSRSVPVPEWARKDLDRWKRTLSKTSAPPLPDTTIMRANAFSGNMHGFAAEAAMVRGRVKDKESQWAGAISSQGIWYLVKKYADLLGVEIRPHDLRRTFAKLLRNAGVELEQIQLMLGHSKLETTEKYLGGRLELELGIAGVDLVESLREGSDEDVA